MQNITEKLGALLEYPLLVLRFPLIQVLQPLFNTAFLESVAEHALYLFLVLPIPLSFQSIFPCFQQILRPFVDAGLWGFTLVALQNRRSCVQWSWLLLGGGATS